MQSQILQIEYIRDFSIPILVVENATDEDIQDLVKKEGATTLVVQEVSYEDKLYWDYAVHSVLGTQILPGTFFDSKLEAINEGKKFINSLAILV